MRIPHRLAVRVAGLGRSPNVLEWRPEPPERGDAAAARRLAGGVWLLDGRLAEANGASPWDIPAPDTVWTAALHGQAWLDDVHAADTPKIWGLASDHVRDWLGRFGGGSGPGWAPDTVARRTVRWIAYSTRLLKSRDAAYSQAFFKALGRQHRFLDLQWQETPHGLPQIEALTGLVYAQLSLRGTDGQSKTLVKTVGTLASQVIQSDGTTLSRNPEELVRIISLLIWSRDLIESAGIDAAPGHVRAIRAGRETIKALSYPNGELPRYHGGRAAAPHPIITDDRPAMPGSTPRLAMGFVRVTAGAADLAMDGANAPDGQWKNTAHSSALALEFRHDGQPLFGSTGSGQSFGPAHAVASRRAEAHSTIELDGRGAGQLTSSKGMDAASAILTIGGSVTTRIDADDDGAWVIGECAHYMTRLGLRIERRLHLSASGLKLSGEDTALAPDARSRSKISGLFPKNKSPCQMRSRFVLHPDVRAAHTLSGRGIGLTLPDGQVWVMRADTKTLDLIPAVYFDEMRPQPRATTEIVAMTSILEYWGRIVWSFEQLTDAAQ
ncbi:MAG: heparinase II/III family protein [Pseudomonadota bacterium]